MGELVKRWVFLLLGLVLFGVGIALMVHAELGLGPWDVLHQGIARLVNMPIGTVTIIIGVPIMLAWLPLNQRVGIGTLLNIVLIGTVTNVVLGMLPHVDNLTLRAALMLGGVVIVGVGSGLYLSSNMGAGPRDGLMIGLAERTGWSVRLVRTLIELVVLLSGVLLGGTIGIGTLVFAFGIGPVVQISLRLFERPTAHAAAPGKIAVHNV